MRKILVVLVVSGVLILALSVPALAQSENACWGLVTQAYAQVDPPGTLGEHASQEATPRFGLRNLARALADAGVIPDDSMQALARFVDEESGLNVCPESAPLLVSGKCNRPMLD